MFCLCKFILLDSSLSFNLSEISFPIFQKKKKVYKNIRIDAYMTLKEYKKKRKFSGKEKTSEPEGKKSNSSNKSTTPPATAHKGRKNKKIFVIHKHDASHLHWDLRLEMSGVLKSWAVPKKPPTKKGTKRLAIAVEDHPLSYADFEGTIPEGHYGAGTVEIWDSGFYELKDKDKKKIEIIFDGKKLKGKYVLIKTNYGNKPEKSWLFFKV